MFKHLKRVSLGALLAISASGMSGCLATGGCYTSDDSARCVAGAVTNAVADQAERDAKTENDRQAAQLFRIFSGFALGRR